MKKIVVSVFIIVIVIVCLLNREHPGQHKEFSVLREILHEKYGQDIGDIRDAIDVMSSNCYCPQQQNVYLVAKNYYAAAEHDYQSVIDQLDENIAYFIEQEALTELAMMYTIGAFSYYELGQYLNSFELIKEIQPLVQHQHSKFQTDSMLKMLIFLNLLDIEIQSYLDSSTKPAIIRNQTTNILFKDVSLTHDFFEIIFEYYYSKSTYEVADSYAELILDKYGNQLTYANFVTNLLRYTDTFIMFEKMEEAKSLYSYTIDIVEHNEQSLSLLEKIEFLRLSSKFHLKDQNYQLALGNLIKAGELATKEKSYLVKVLIVRDLGDYYQTIGQPLIANDFNKLETKIAKEYLSQALIISRNNTQLWELLNVNDYVLALAAHQNKLLKLLKWIVVLTILMVPIGSVIYAVYQLQIKQLNKQLQFLSGHLTNQLKYYKSMTTYHEKTSELALDLQQEQRNLMKLMSNKQYDRFIKRVNQLCQKSTDKKIESLTLHPILDALLQNKKALCEANNINLTIVIDLLAEIEMSDLDIVTLTSNALDNAFEACLNITDKTVQKEINFFIKAQGNMILIQVKNNKEHELKPHKGLFQTTKTDSHEAHGIGLSSIERICNKYDGSLTFDHTQTTFTINILLKNVKNNKVDLQ